MKKNHLFLLLLVSFFLINVSAMYSSIEPYYTLKVDQIYGDEITEVEIMILSGGTPNKPTYAGRAMSAMSAMSFMSTEDPEVKPISLFQNEAYLKTIITLDEKVNIKVLNSTTSLPVYMRQYVPDTSGEMMIDTSSWSGGYYNVIFTNASGEAIAKGIIYID